MTLLGLDVMVNKGDAMLFHFLTQGSRLNANIYIKVLDTVIKHWIEVVAMCLPVELCSYLHGSCDP